MSSTSQVAATWSTKLMGNVCARHAIAVTYYIIKEDINVRSLSRRANSTVPTTLTTPSMMIISLRASIKWYIRTSFCLRIGSPANPHMLMIIIKEGAPNHLKNLSPRASSLSARTPSRPIPAMLKIIWIEANLKELKKCNYPKTSLCLKVNSMVVPITPIIMLEREHKSQINIVLLANSKQVALSREFPAT